MPLGDNPQKRKGFGSNSQVQQHFISAKGGRVKTKKGLGAMPPDKAIEIQRLGGLKRQQQLREEKNGKDFISSGNTSNS